MMISVAPSSPVPAISARSCSELLKADNPLNEVHVDGVDIEADVLGHGDPALSHVVGVFAGEVDDAPAFNLVTAKQRLDRGTIGGEQEDRGFSAARGSGQAVDELAL